MPALSRGLPNSATNRPALQVNMKLGGANGILERSLFQVPGTMVIGVDVNHAKPGSVQNSFAAVVATLDKDATKFHTEVRVRPFRPGPLLLGTRDEYLTGRPMPYDSIHSMCADLGARSSSRAARANWRGHENALPCMAATQQNRSYVRPIRAHLPATSHGCRHKRM